MDCLFCKIAAGTIPVKLLHEDAECVAFADINPQAPTHVLVIPRKHYGDVGAAPAEVLGHVLHVAAGIGGKELAGGYRVVVNTGADGGQTVGHLHLHVLGGRAMHWPPG